MFNNINWSDIIIGGFFGAIVSPAIYFLFRAIWLRIPISLRMKISYIYRRVLSKNPYWQETDVSSGMKNIIDYSASRIFIIRIGNLHMNNKIYSERINHMIEADHIWDWHFFLKNNLAGQNVNGWIKDFYHIDDNAISIIEENSTTELGIIKHSDFKNNSKIKLLFSEYGLNTNFDDLIIYGVIKGVNTFPEISDLSYNYIDKLQVERIILFYNDGESTKEVIFGAKKMAKDLIECIVYLYNPNCKLYIDQEITDSNKKSGLLLINEINN